MKSDTDLTGEVFGTIITHGWQLTSVTG